MTKEESANLGSQTVRPTLWNLRERLSTLSPQLVPQSWLNRKDPIGRLTNVRCPTVRLCPPDSPPPCASNLSNNLAAAASEQILVEASAQHLVMLASGAREHTDTSEEAHVSTPESDHYPSDPRSEYDHVDILVPEAAQQCNPFGLPLAN